VTAALMPLPVPSVETEPFWAAVQERRLIMPQCEACKTVTFPPSVACPRCSGSAFAWTEMSGRGKVYSFVVYHRVYHPAFKDKVPYVLAVIELDEGPRIVSNVVEIPVDQVRCEMPVEVVYEEVRDGYLIPKFKPCHPEPVEG
jgi:uncharacterized OB-fold protein